MKDNCFTPFNSQPIAELIPDRLNDPFGTATPEICKIAANELQHFIANNEHKWQHNFGLNNHKEGTVKGKMFGVLVVENAHKEIGYLSAFSGKIKDNPHPSIFVPSLFDLSTDDYFLTIGMTELTKMGDEIKALTLKNTATSLLAVERIKKERKEKSTGLQQELFNQYHFFK